MCKKVTLTYWGQDAIERWEAKRRSSQAPVNMWDRVTAFLIDLYMRALIPVMIVVTTVYAVFGCEARTKRRGGE